MPKKTKASIKDLLAIMADLRTPGSGCPWDLQQTFGTIAPYTIEEAYEVADAIEKGDMIALKDELGDLLLQVVYHARMAEEQGSFAFEDVVDAIGRKMIRRHPHVFGTAEERAAGAAPGFWERIKGEEKAARAAGRHGVLDGIPLGLPALTRATKLQDRAARVGFDWPSLAPVLNKLKEELGELEAAISSQEGHTPKESGAGAHDQIEEEFGDLVFVIANVARHLQIDPEHALRRANEKFTRRFHAIERKLAASGRTPAQSDLAEMDRLWNEVKAEESE